MTAFNTVIDTYQENGITVKVYQGCILKPTPTHRALKPKHNKPPKTWFEKRDYTDTPYARNPLNYQFKQWCAKRSGRLLAIVDKSPYCKMWFQLRRYGNIQLTQQNWDDTIYPLMLKVEQEEKEPNHTN